MAFGKGCLCFDTQVRCSHVEGHQKEAALEFANKCKAIVCLVIVSSSPGRIVDGFVNIVD